MKIHQNRSIFTWYCLFRLNLYLPVKFAPSLVGCPPSTVPSISLGGTPCNRLHGLLVTKGAPEGFSSIVHFPEHTPNLCFFVCSRLASVGETKFLDQSNKQENTNTQEDHFAILFFCGEYCFPTSHSIVSSSLPALSLYFNETLLQGQTMELQKGNFSRCFP